MNILALDVTYDKLVVCASKDDKIEYLVSEETNKRHNSLVMPYIESVLTKLNLSVKNIDVFACVVGPGSFTGIRIGIATIKALAYVTNKPCISISSLEEVAFNHTGDFYAAIDAKHDSYYAALFNGTWENMSDVGSYSKEQLDQSGKIVYFKDKESNPECLIEIAKDKANKGQFGDLMPLYLKKSQAEREKDGE